MRPRLFALFASLALLVAAPATAKDFCVQNAIDDVFVFRNPKLPKKPLEVVSVVGYMRAGDFVFPFEGSILNAGQGLVAIGITVHALTFDTDRSITAVVDRTTFAGEAAMDRDDGGDADVEDVWTAISCDSL